MSEESRSPADHFHEAQRHLAGLTARAERRALLWLAPRTPPAITSDHLTLLGLGSMAAGGALYAASGRYPWLLLLVNLALALNWLGDSLDGTLARHRGAERPRFGFYVDHLADAFGALLVLAGLALSGLMSPLVAAVFLVAYFLLAIETHLATYAIGRFKISWGPVGGTELRILLAAANVVALFRPRVSAAGGSWLLFDVAGGVASAALLVLAVIAGIRGTRALARTEGWAPPGRADRGPGGRVDRTSLFNGEALSQVQAETPESHLPGGLLAPRTPSMPTA
jgi:phosphatidylglycerophosphate synthase